MKGGDFFFNYYFLFFAETLVDFKRLWYPRSHSYNAGPASSSLDIYIFSCIYEMRSNKKIRSEDTQTAFDFFFLKSSKFRLHFQIQLLCICQGCKGIINFCGCVARKESRCYAGCMMVPNDRAFGQIRVVFWQRGEKWKLHLPSTHACPTFFAHCLLLLVIEQKWRFIASGDKVCETADAPSFKSIVRKHFGFSRVMN